MKDGRGGTRLFHPSSFILPTNPFPESCPKMSNTYTPSIKLAQPALGDTGWSVPVNSNCATLDALAPVGGLAVTTHEQPSSSLKVDVAAGSYVKQDGTIGTIGA